MKATQGHNVSVHYIGTLSDGTEFDNSYVRGETLDFTIGTPGLLVDFVEQERPCPSEFSYFILAKIEDRTGRKTVAALRHCSSFPSCC